MEEFETFVKNLELNLELTFIKKPYLTVVIGDFYGFFCFLSIWVFFYEHSLFTGHQGKGEGIFLTPLYHFHPLRRHLDISWAITAELAAELEPGTFGFRAQVAKH